MLQASAAEEAEKTGRTLEDVIVELRKSNPQNRLVQPSEVADLIAYLCGEGSVALTMRSVETAGRLERTLGKPVVCSNQAMIFAALRYLDIEPGPVQCGRLLQHPCERF